MNDAKDPMSGYLEALRNDLPTVEDDARMRARLRALGMTIPVVGAATTAAGVTAWAWWAKASLVTALVVGPSAAMMVVSRSNESPEEAVVVVHEVAPDASTSRMRATSKRSEVVDAPAMDSVFDPEPTASPSTSLSSSNARMQRSTRQSAASSSRRSPPTPRVSTLAAETALLGKALAAIEAEDYGAAHAALREHATQFPGGELRRERLRAERRLEHRLQSDIVRSPQSME